MDGRDPPQEGQEPVGVFSGVCKHTASEIEQDNEDLDQSLCHDLVLHNASKHEAEGRPTESCYTANGREIKEGGSIMDLQVVKEEGTEGEYEGVVPEGEDRCQLGGQEIRTW